MKQTLELTEAEIQEAVARWCGAQIEDVKIIISKKTCGYGLQETEVNTVKAEIQI